MKAHVGLILTLFDRFLLCSNPLSNPCLLCAKPAPEHKSIKYPLRDSRIVGYDSGIGGQTRNSHFAQVQFRNRTDSHFALNIYTSGPSFRAISFEFIGVWIHIFIRSHIIIKYRSSSIEDKIHLLLTQLWPLISKSVSAQYLKNEFMEFDKTLHMH